MLTHNKCNLMLHNVLTVSSVVCVHWSDKINSFYPRDVVSAVCYGNVAGWLAGWVSITRRYCIKTAKPILKLFRPSGSPTILVSSDPATIPNSKGNPSAGASNTRVGKLAIFDGYRRLSRKRCEIGRWFLWKVNLIGSHGCRIQWYHFR